MLLKKSPKRLIICLLAFVAMDSMAQIVPSRESICGKWENEGKSLRIQIYTVQGDFRAKIIWFSDTEGKPMGYWKDRKNPDPRLRSRPLLGMSILSGLKYNIQNNDWEDGKVYDSRHGRYWNASAYIDKNGILKVRGYWHFKFIGKTMNFHRIK